jgi:hypothetical protein
MLSSHNTSLLFVLLLAYPLLISASPALKVLPSITMDTVNDEPFDPLDTSESIPIPIVGPIMAYTAMNRLRSMWNGAQTAPAPQPHGRIERFLVPFRMVRDVGSGIYAMAHTFADTFNNQFQEQVKTLSSQMQETVLPQAANLMGVWKNPQNEDYSWMEGI